MLSIDDVDVPAPGHGEVRIRVGAIGLNRVEVTYRQGGFGTSVFPAKIGYEAAGTIEAVGEGVPDFKVGDRVACIPGLSMEQYGTYGELILYPANMLVRTPDNQSDAEAAATWMQYLTAYGVRYFRPLRPGDPVVITAASSSVGLATIELVKADGAVPIAVTRGRGKMDALKRHGAGHVIVSGEQDVAEAVMRLTNGYGARLVFDAVGGPAFPALFAALGQDGLAIIYGALGGEPTHLPARMMTAKQATIRGYAMNHLVTFAGMRARALKDIGDGIATGRLKPVIDRSFALADIADAHRYLEGNSQVGKIVVTI